MLFILLGCLLNIDVLVDWICSGIVSQLQTTVLIVLQLVEARLNEIASVKYLKEIHSNAIKHLLCYHVSIYMDPNKRLRIVLVTNKCDFESNFS